MTFTRTHFFLAAGISLLGVLLNILFLQSPVVGGIAYFLFFIIASFWIGLQLKYESTVHAMILGGIFLGSILSLIASILYYIFGLTGEITMLLAMLPLPVFLLNRQTTATCAFPSLKNIPWQRCVHGCFILFGDLFLLVTLYTHRTTSFSPSPWQQLNASFFLLFAVVQLLVFLFVYKAKKEWTAISITSLHLSVIWSIATLMYPLGFGFDAFIHRATELWIANNDVILPKQPYYTGQYVMVAFLARITKLSVFSIDVFLVPLLASLTLPAVLSHTMKRIWNFSFQHALILVWLIAFVPILSLHLTTPFNLILLLSILTIFLTLAALVDKINWTLPLLLTFVTLITHALLGIPLTLFVISAFLMQRSASKTRMTILTFALVGISLSIPAVFAINNIRLGGESIILTNPIRELPKFFELFARPYWYAARAPLQYELVYAWQQAIVPVFIILGIFGLFFSRKEARIKQGVRPLFIVTIAGLVISAWFLRSWIHFADVVAYEQADYPLRLLRASLLFLLPWSMYGLWYLAGIVKKRARNVPSLAKEGLGVVAAIVASILLMVSLYLAYPQRNIKARFPGFNITYADMDVVRSIHSQHQNYDYVVLSNQLTSAAALTEYSFAKYFQTPRGELFYYSIPTGGPLYQLYGKMLYEGQKREYMEEAMALVGVDKSYFVLNKYWANSDKIIEGAKVTADSWKTFAEGTKEEVWVFEYSLKH